MGWDFSGKRRLHLKVVPMSGIKGRKSREWRDYGKNCWTTCTASLYPKYRRTLGSPILLITITLLIMWLVLEYPFLSLDSKLREGREHVPSFLTVSLAAEYLLPQVCHDWLNFWNPQTYPSPPAPSNPCTLHLDFLLREPCRGACSFYALEWMNSCC